MLRFKKKFCDYFTKFSEHSQFLAIIVKPRITCKNYIQSLHKKKLQKSLKLLKKSCCKCESHLINNFDEIKFLLNIDWNLKIEFLPASSWVS